MLARKGPFKKFTLQLRPGGQEGLSHENLRESTPGAASASAQTMGGTRAGGTAQGTPMRLQCCDWYEMRLEKEVKARSYRPFSTKVNSWDYLPSTFRLCIGKQILEGKERTHFCLIQLFTLIFVNFMGHGTEPASCIPRKHVFLLIFILEDDVLTRHKLGIYIQIAILEETVH